jgi:HTH-type transcriptional regulator, sugar sensing transcriptional regulator
VYGVLLDLGPSTGYGVAAAAGCARANTYAALEGLVRRGAAHRSEGRPVRYRAADPNSLVLLLAGEQGEQLERLSRALASLGGPADAVTKALDGARAIANVIQQLVARASLRVDGVIAAALWGPTLPAWRRAATRATLQVRVAGEVADTEGLATAGASPDLPTLLLVDDAYTLVAADIGGRLIGMWSGDPLVAVLSRLALVASR